MLVHSTGIVRNEPICGYASVVQTASSFCTQTYTIILFGDGELTGLKLDIADVSSLLAAAADQMLMMGELNILRCWAATDQQVTLHREICPAATDLQVTLHREICLAATDQQVTLHREM